MKTTNQIITNYLMTLIVNETMQAYRNELIKRGYGSDYYILPERCIFDKEKGYTVAGIWHIKRIFDSPYTDREVDYNADIMYLDLVTRKFITERDYLERKDKRK